jgi:hypothetical protein
MVIWKIKDKEYNLRLTTRACTNVEKRLGTNPLNVFSRLSGNEVPALSDLLVILHESINTLNHGISFDALCDLYDDYCDDGGDISTLIELIIEVLQDSGIIPKDLKNQ